LEEVASERVVHWSDVAVLRVGGREGRVETRGKRGKAERVGNEGNGDGELLRSGREDQVAVRRLADGRSSVLRVAAEWLDLVSEALQDLRAMA
jgi:hypothetical protein